MKKYQTFLAIKEIKIKMKLRFPLTPVRMGENKQQQRLARIGVRKQPLYTLSGNVS
jgi:hypothetical protein